MKARLTHLAVDVTVLFAILTGIGLFSGLLAFHTWDYLRINLVAGLFLLPGWCVSYFMAEDRDNFFTRLFWAGVLSLILYAALALVCRTCGLGFDSLYVLFGTATIGIAGLVLFRSDVYTRRLKVPSLSLPQWIIVGALLATFILFYRAPYSNDLGQYTGQTIDMQRQRDFHVSTFGMECFGIHEAMPRYKANLFHALMAVVADLSGINSVAVSEYLLTIPLGLLAILAMYSFIRQVAGMEIPFPIIVLSFLAPVTLFWRPVAAYDPYDYSFRLLNSACVDKDFGLFFIFPACLCLAILYIRSGKRRYLAGLALLALLSNFLHPMVPIYFLMSIGVLWIAYGPRHWRRLATIAAVAVCAFAWGIVLGYAVSHHDAISSLVFHDVRHTGGKSYWMGQYVTVPSSPSYAFLSIAWIHGYMTLHPGLFLRSSLLLFSFPATAVWASILAWYWWRNRPISEDERTAFRFQLGFMGVVVAIFAFSPLFFLFYPHLFRGYERLHWMYFGFFPFVFLIVHAWKRCCAWLGESSPRLTAIRFVVYALLVFHATDQSVAIRKHRKTWFESVIPVVHSRAGSPAFDYMYRWIKDDWRASELPDRRKLFYVKPDWLHPGDRVMDLDQYSSSGYKAMWYWIMKQSVYWTELFGEAFAYVKRGPAFLDDWDAYRDARHWRASDRLVRFLKEKHVTLIITEPPNDAINSFLQELRVKAGGSLTTVESGVYRIRPPLIESGHYRTTKQVITSRP